MIKKTLSKNNIEDEQMYKKIFLLLIVIFLFFIGTAYAPDNSSDNGLNVDNGASISNSNDLKQSDTIINYKKSYYKEKVNKNDRTLNNNQNDNKTEDKYT